MNNPNLAQLEAVIDRLGTLADEMVLVGGCAASLLVGDVINSTIRTTEDVDTVIKVGTLHDYYEFEKRLRHKGFSNDTREDAPRCRYVHKELVLDVMPADGSILHFNNRWYHDVLLHAEKYTLPSGAVIKLISSPFFLLTKFDALNDRGLNDMVASKDLDDIIAVINWSENIVADIQAAPVHAQTALSNDIRTFLDLKNHMFLIQGNIEGDAGNQQRTPLIVNKMQAIVNMETL